MREMFLIGHGISHSLSPAMWNHLFQSTGRQVRYGLRDVDTTGLSQVVSELHSGTVVAANVTMPHKVWAAGIANEASEVVRATGVANLLVPNGETLRAHNTDVTGARTILESRAPYESVLILGAGGTAVALLEALAGLATTVVVTNRSPDRAADLVKRFEDSFASMDATPWDDRDGHVPLADLIVSTIPVTGVAPIDVTRMRSHALVYDAIYRTEPTVFQRALADRGIPVADGLAHLAAQAIAALDPLSIDPKEASLLVDGLTQVAGREPQAWGTPLS